MPTSAASFHPGALVRARDREWVVQPGSTASVLRLRPLGGSEDDVTTLLPDLEFQPPEPATFPDPDPARPGNHSAALLLRDALLLKLRAGAGPFRSFANIAVEPRAYQLVPLLMALRQPTVRLLIGDDVGIGKTIEAGLIVRELWDRGEISRFAVLCPPHLVDQWQSELANHFHLQAVALTASSVGRLERSLPPGVSFFDHYPIAVVSLDYIKSERHCDHFLSIAPECIIVDEAHTCASAGQGRHLRFSLLRKLADDPLRHMILLTATPHSGDDAAFQNLLSLLAKEFDRLLDAAEPERSRLRERLAAHFVQRRRKDIDEWQDASVFPRRLTSEVTYRLTGEWGEFFDAVQDYCVALASGSESTATESGRRMIWYATLALLRCVGSSPAAAERALTTRLAGTEEEMAALADEERLLDGEGADPGGTTDIEPPGALADSGQLRSLIERARALGGRRSDPKLRALFAHLEELLNLGARPVIFCRYIATARYVAAHLTRHFRSATVAAVTGELTPEEREQIVGDLIGAEKPVLVATDCLSEGINLQHGFDAVVHYDLAWNPTRHEQREGRVDRFGQKAEAVRCTMLYGQDNPVDGFILRVIVGKAERIRRDLGIVVPLPQDTARMNHAMIRAALLKRSSARSRGQLEFDFDSLLPDELQPLETAWTDALAKARANRTIFAQRRLRPQDVLPEWRRQLDLIGDSATIARFVHTACQRLDSPLEALGAAWRFIPGGLPASLRERLALEGLDREILIDFHYPPAPRARYIHRTHPLVAVLADHLLEGTLQGTSNLAARCAVTETPAVTTVTTLYLLRLRHQLTATRRDSTRTLLAEETVPLALEGRTSPRWLDDATLPRLLEVTPAGNLDPAFVTREITAALQLLRASQDRLEDLARRRAAALLDDHRRVREASRDHGSWSVTPVLPVDIIGVYVLLPAPF